MPSFPRRTPLLRSALALLTLFFGLSVAIHGQDDPRGPGGGKGTGNIVDLPEGYVRTMRLPNGGRRPSVLQEPDGSVHLVYAVGDLAAADVYYLVSRDYGDTFSEPMRVNSELGTADFSGSSEGPGLSVSPGQPPHVVWTARPGRAGTELELHYARLRGDGFEAERSLVQGLSQVGPCTDVAVDPEGRVFVFFSALGELPPKPETSDEPDDTLLRLYMTVSGDGGDSFTAPRAIDPPAHGVSPTSDLSAEANAKGWILVAYRIALEGKKRDVRLLTSRDGGDSFKTKRVAPWFRGRDPGASLQLLRGRRQQMLLTWEADFQVYWAPVVQDHIEWPLDPKPLDTNLYRRHSSVAENDGNEILLSWIERERDETIDKSRLVWEVLDRGRRIRLGRGRLYDGHPEQPAVFTRQGGGFTVVY